MNRHPHGKGPWSILCLTGVPFGLELVDFPLALFSSCLALVCTSHSILYARRFTHILSRTSRTSRRHGMGQPLPAARARKPTNVLAVRWPSPRWVRHSAPECVPVSVLRRKIDRFFCATNNKEQGAGKRERERAKERLTASLSPPHCDKQRRAIFLHRHLSAAARSRAFTCLVHSRPLFPIHHHHQQLSPIAPISNGALLVSRQTDHDLRQITLVQTESNSDRKILRSLACTIDLRYRRLLSFDKRPI